MYGPYRHPNLNFMSVPDKEWSLGLGNIQCEDAVAAALHFNGRRYTWYTYNNVLVFCFIKVYILYI
jgi:hypothetical protein